MVILWCGSVEPYLVRRATVRVRRRMHAPGVGDMPLSRQRSTERCDAPITARSPAAGTRASGRIGASINFAEKSEGSLVPAIRSVTFTSPDGSEDQDLYLDVELDVDGEVTRYRPATPCSGRKSSVVPEPVGPKVRRLRLGADLTLERLSELSGISDRALSDIERGVVRGPQRRTVLAIAQALDLSVGDRAAITRAARAGRRRPQPTRRPLPPLLPSLRDVPDFTGRAQELAQITTALCRPQPPLVALTGPPGYGKTSLAVRGANLVRNRFPEQLLISLGGTTPQPPSADVIASRVLRALTGRRCARGRTEEELQQALADRSLLLVLDDAAAESQIRAVLPRAGQAAVLVTSRRSLAGLEGAERIPVDRLPAADAQRLLATIIRSDRGDGAELARLAQLCDCVPLALRIAGNRLASRPGSTAQRLTDRMAVTDRRLDLLAAGDLRMRTTFRASFAQLGAAAQRLFRRLAMIDAPTFGVELAAALLGKPPQRAEDILDELVDSGLVQPSAGDRYALHDLLHLYAAAELAAHEAPADRAALRSRTDKWLLSTAVAASCSLCRGIATTTSRGADSSTAFESPELAQAWLTDEAENWRSALERNLRRDRRDMGSDLIDVESHLRR
jgi:transcriptional regulator with XRE-family HTH domain